MNIFGIEIDRGLVDLVGLVIKAVIWIFVLLTVFAYIQLVERWVLARIQVRIGPNRTGPRGLLQPLADGIKALFKEELIPTRADKLVFVLAPIISVVAALIAFAVIPVGPPITNPFGKPIPLEIANVDVGLLYLLAIGSLSVYGTVLAGWSSNNKYSLLGALRAAAQLVSYEIPLGLALVGVIMLSSSLRLTTITEQQKDVWNVVLSPLGFIIYLIAAIAETNRLPFDLPEAETELIAGYYTEYSSIKFAFFFMAEYINIITVCAIATVVFLGGYNGPIAPGIWWFALKVFLLIFLFMWIRGTLPRLRYDQLMNFCWKVMLPLALFNVLLTAIVIIVFNPHAAQTLAFGILH